MTRIALLWTRIGAEAAASWRVPKRVAYALFLLPFAGGIVVALTRANKPAFKAITGEDRLLEYAQFGLYVAAGILALLVAHTVWHSASRVTAIAYVVFGIGALYVAGEEISWGQRLFGFDTPVALERINEQLETTTHNIGPVQNAFTAVIFLVALYGLVSPWYLARRGTRAEAPSRLFVPPLFLTGIFLFVVGYRLIRWIVFPQGFTVTEYGEWSEFCFSLGLATFALLNFLLLREPLDAVAPRAAELREIGSAAGGETVRLAKPDK